MAEVLRYINPASTPGGDGTTNGTIGVNRAYASMLEWDAAEATDLVSAGDTHRVRCSAGIDNAGKVTLTTPWVTGTSNYITIENDDGVPTGVDGQGYILQISALAVNEVFQNSAAYTRFSGITFHNISNNSSSRAVFNLRIAYYDSCIFKNDSSSGTGFYNSVDASGSMVNCLAISVAVGFYAGNFDNGQWSNNTAVGGTTGFWRAGTGGGNMVTTNCVAFGQSNLGFNGSKLVGTNNASEDSSATGSGSITGIAASDFADYAGGDYSPASGGNLDGTGADLSGSFSDDITGALRTVPWTIGAYIVSGAPPVGIQEMYVNIGGTFTKATPSVLVGGVWQPADAYVLVAGVWKPVYEQ